MTASIRTRRPRDLRGAAERAVARLTTHERPRVLEFMVYAGLLAVATFLLLNQHVRAAGFYSDDWAYRTQWVGWRSGGFWHALGELSDTDPLHGRPTLAVYLSLTQELFGFHQHWHLAWAAVLAVVLSTSLYLLLRTLRFSPLAAGLIGLLVLVFPGSDSTRIWAIISDAQVAMSLVFIGLTCSIVSMSTPGWKGRALRAAGLLLMALGLTMYELTFGALLFAFLLYRTRAPWRRVLKHAALDWVVLGLVYVLVLSQSTAQRQGLSETIDHGWNVLKDTLTLFSTVVLPFSSIAPGVIASLTVVALAIVVARTLPAEDATRRALVRWLTVAGIAVVMVIGAYAIYAPAAEFYQPMAPGLENRTNAFGAIPLLILIYALVALAATMVFRGLRGGNTQIAVTTGLVVVLIGIGYTKTMTDHIKLWDSGWARAQTTERTFTQRVPKLPPQALVIFFGQPILESPGIPVWAHFWDLDGAIRLHYGDLSVRARPAFPGTKIVCGTGGGRLTNPVSTSVVLPTDNAAYRYLYLYNTATGALAVPKSRRECLKALPAYTPGPLVAPDPGAYAP